MARGSGDRANGSFICRSKGCGWDVAAGPWSNTQMTRGEGGERYHWRGAGYMQGRGR